MKKNNTNKKSRMIQYIAYYRLEKPFLQGFFNPIDFDVNQERFTFMNRSDRGSIRSDWSVVGQDLSDAMMTAIHQ